MAKHFISVKTPFSLIACEEAFNGLEEKQTNYAFNFARASWNGAKICFFERSYESPALLYIIIKGLGGQNIREVGSKIATVSAEDQEKIFYFTAAFLENAGNFKSFGDSKFIPETSIETFVNFWKATEYWSKHPEDFDKIWNRIQRFVFQAEKPYALIQFSDKEGSSGYYSKNCSCEDAEKIKKILIDKGLMSENNRLVKVSETEYIVKIASETEREETFEKDGIKITLKYGEFGPFLKLVNQYLTEARKFSANEIQEKMIDEYIEHFKNGDMKRHKESQKHWIQDKQPDIETNIGFIESYLDPLRVRAEFEGFVSIVNKKESILLSKLVEEAPTLLTHLPWGSQFEVEVFKKPDFTSLEILAFASSGVPVGINIPNYDDIRENFGFKNVNLGNAYGEPTAETMQYTPEEEIAGHLKWYKESLFVIVALHELLGHGSGKLFREKITFNSVLDGSEFTTFYGENETWHSVFGEIASTYEECRADSVALYLSLYEDVQQILLPTLSAEEKREVVELAWFDMIEGGIKGLVHYDVESNKWLQAHIGASYAIFSVLRKEGGIFEIKETEKNGKPYIEIILNKQAIYTKGKQAIGNFLKHLQVYKSTADFKKGSEYFQQFLEVDEQILKYREVVELNRKPRRISIQPYLDLVDGKPVYRKYEAKVEDCIDSFVRQYSEEPEEILKQWELNNQEFMY